MFYFARMTVQAANMTVVIAYAAALWPALGEGIPRYSAIILIIGSLTALNIVGIRRVVAVLGILTLFKLLPLLLLIGVGLMINPPIASVTLPEFSAVEGVALAALYGFVGFENATVPAGEANNPKMAMPRGLLVSLAIVTFFYFGLQLVYSNSPVAGSGSPAPLASLAGYYAGNIGSLLITATVAVSVLGNMIAGHTTASRMTAALSDDRLIPGWFGQVSRWGTPANSIMFFGVGALLFALTGTFITLAVSGTLSRLLVYIVSIGALPRLRNLMGLKAITLPIGIAAPIALSLSLWACFQSSTEQWVLIAGFVSVGTLLFCIGRSDRSSSSPV